MAIHQFGEYPRHCFSARPRPLFRTNDCIPQSFTIPPNPVCPSAAVSAGQIALVCKVLRGIMLMDSDNAAVVQRMLPGDDFKQGVTTRKRVLL